MKLIMENWKKFLTEQTQMDMITGPGGESPDTDDYYEKYKDSLTPRFRKNLERMEDGCREMGPESGYCEQVRRAKEIARKQQKSRETPYKKSEAIKTAETIMKIMFLMLDPTGQVGDIDVNTGKVTPQHKILKQEFNNFKEKPSLLGAGSVALASLGMIPILGAAGKLGKIKTIGKIKANPAQRTPLGVTYNPKKEMGNVTRRAEIIKNKINSAARKAKDPNHKKRLELTARMLEKGIKDARQSLGKLHDYSSGFQQGKVKGATLKALSSKTTNFAKASRAATQWTGKLYKGESVGSILDFRRLFRVSSDYGPAVAKGENYKFDFAQEILKDAQRKKGQWVKFRTPEGTTIKSTLGGKGSRGESFTKSLDYAEDMSKGVFPGKPSKGNIEVLIVTKGNKAENIDVVSHLQKTGEKVGDVGYAPIGRTAKEAQDVIMLGDRIPIEQIWIRVN